MKALIGNDDRIYEIRAAGDIFDVAPPLRWVDAPVGATTETHRVDGTGAIVPRPAPTPVRALSPHAFMSRFSATEKLAIHNSSVAAVQLAYLSLITAANVGLDDPRTIAGLDALVAANLITAPRKAELLA